MAKIGIIGAGQVGASCAFALAQAGVAEEIALADIKTEKAAGEALDIAHGVPLLPAVRVTGGGYAEIDGADVVVMTAGANQAPNETRRDLLLKNLSVMQDAAREIARRAPACVLLVVTNPVDALTRAALAQTGFSPERVLGSGTVLDSQRLRFMLSEHTGVDARSIHAYVLGEHGDSELPAWSTVSIAGMTLEEYCRDCGGCDAHLPGRMREAFDENYCPKRGHVLCHSRGRTPHLRGNCARRTFHSYGFVASAGRIRHFRRLPEPAVRGRPRGRSAAHCR